MDVFGLEDEAEVPRESPCEHREGSMEYITVRGRSNTAVKLTWPALKKWQKIMLTLTIFKIKLLYYTFSNWNWNSYAAINTLKRQILTFYDQLAWPKQGDNPSSTCEVGKHGGSNFLSIIELIRYFANWCIYLLEQTLTPTHVCKYNMIWLCGKPNIVSPYIVPNSHPKLLSVTNWRLYMK